LARAESDQQAEQPVPAADLEHSTGARHRRLDGVERRGPPPRAHVEAIAERCAGEQLEGAAGGRRAWGAHGQLGWASRAASSAKVASSNPVSSTAASTAGEHSA